MTLKQINRDIFKRDHSTCYKRIKKFTDLKLISFVPIDFTIDHSFSYTLTKKGMRIVTSNHKGIIDGKRFKSNSINHDLKLVNVKNMFSQFKMVKSYVTENQIQTYKSYTIDEELKLFKELQIDALANIQDQGKPRISVPIELEISTKSRTEYENKIRDIYYHKGIKFFFYICEDKITEDKIKKVEHGICPNGEKKIFYLSYEMLLSSVGSVKFMNQNNQTITLN
jgi:hypothetical protein